MSASPRTTAMALAPAEPIGTSSPPSWSASHDGCRRGRVRLTMSRGGPARGRASGSGGAGREGEVRARAARPRRPRARRRWRARRAPPSRCGDLAELAGAVERIDDPDPLGPQASGSSALLGQHGVAGRASARPARPSAARGPAIALVLRTLAVDALGLEAGSEIDAQGRRHGRPARPPGLHRSERRVRRRGWRAPVAGTVGSGLGELHGQSLTNSVGFPLAR